LVSHVSFDTYWGSSFDASPSGVIVYRRDLTGFDRRIAWLDQSGALDWMAPEKAAYREPRLSGDGKRLAIIIVQDGKSRVWIRDLMRHTSQPVGAAEDQTDSPVWLRNGEALLLRANGSLAWVSGEGAGPIHKVEGDVPAGIGPRDTTPDGRLLFR